MPMIVTAWDGQKISKPGLYSGVPMEKYHSDICIGPSISSSGLRTIFSNSPAHYFLSSPYNPSRIERKDTDAFMIGRGGHHRVLKEPDFDKLFAIRPDKWDSWRTDAAKAWRAEQWLAGKTALEPAQVAAIDGMESSLRADPLVRSGMLDGLIEHSLFWRDDATGVWLKARPDAIPTDAADFADLKCMADVTDEAIERSIGDYGYNQQGALIGEGSRRVLGMEMNSFTLICAEKAQPHSVSSKTLKPTDIDLGQRQNEIALRLFARGIETGRWPGPAGTTSDAAYVELKPWARTRIENRIALLEQELAA